MLETWILKWKRSKEICYTLEKKKIIYAGCCKVKPRMDTRPFSDMYHMQTVYSEFPCSQQTALITATKSKASFKSLYLINFSSQYQKQYQQSKMITYKYCHAPQKEKTVSPRISILNTEHRLKTRKALKIAE